jgi:hypothetical protein
MLLWPFTWISMVSGMWAMIEGMLLYNARPSERRPPYRTPQAVNLALLGTAFGMLNVPAMVVSFMALGKMGEFDLYFEDNT